MRRARSTVVGALVVMAGGCGGGSGSLTGAGGTGGVGTGGIVATGGIVGTGGIVATGGIVGTGGSGPSGPPSAFALLLPIDASSAQPLTPTLSWYPAQGADSYTVEVATTSDFGSSDLVTQTVDGSVNQLTLPSLVLSQGVIYYWRVTAYNGSDYTISSDAPRWFSSPYLVRAAHGLDVTPDGTRVVVASQLNDGPVDVIDLAAHSVSEIQTGVHSNPMGVAVSPDGKHALATLLTNATDGVNGVAIIDLDQQAFVDFIEDPCVGTTLTNVAYFPSGAAAMPDLGPDCASMGLSGFTPDPASPSFSFTNLHDTNDPFDVAIDPTGSWALVTMELDHKLYRVDFGVSVGNMSLSAPSAGVAIAHDGASAVVAEATLDLVDAATGAMTPFPLYQDTPGADFHNVAITPDDQVAAVVGTASIQFLSLPDGKVLAAYPIGAGNSIAISPDGNTAFVSDRANGYVRVVPVP